MSGAICNGCHKMTGSLSNLCRNCQDALASIVPRRDYASAVIDKEAIEASKADKGIFVKLAERALKSSLDNFTAHHVTAFQADCEMAGAITMLEVVKKWLNTEPIEKEIWELWQNKMK